MHGIECLCTIDLGSCHIQSKKRHVECLLGCLPAASKDPTMTGTAIAASFPPLLRPPPLLGVELGAPAPVTGVVVMLVPKGPPTTFKAADANVTVDGKPARYASVITLSNQLHFESLGPVRGGGEHPRDIPSVGYRDKQGFDKSYKLYIDQPQSLMCWPCGLRCTAKNPLGLVTKTAVTNVTLMIVKAAGWSLKKAASHVFHITSVLHGKRFTSEVFHEPRLHSQTASQVFHIQKCFTSQVFHKRSVLQQK